MIDFARFWMKGNNPYEDEDETQGATSAKVTPGVTAEEILEWEREYGVKLPEPIRTALGIRNGGFVRNAPIQVLPLDEIVPADDEFWEYTEIEEDEAPDHRLMFVFGSDTEIGGTLLMNFNARGPEGSPSVYIDHHGESTSLFNETIGGLFEAALASAAGPSVDWSEFDAGVPIIARETIDLSAVYRGKPASEDQVLARVAETLVLLTRERSPEGTVLTRTTLPLPLDAGAAEVRPHRPAPISTFVLHLQPEDNDGIVYVRSETNADGRWKNSTQQGVPIYYTFESTDRHRLQSLRTQLFGTEGAASAQAKQDRQAAFAEMLDTLAPEQRSAALFEAALSIKQETDRQFAAQFGDLGPIPPELAATAEALRLKMEATAGQVRQKSAANPVDPETLRRIKGYLREPDAE
jgi:hypothetical protein